MEKDPRIQLIFDQIVRLANAEFHIKGEVSDKRDDIDSIIVGLNLLGEEIESYTHQLQRTQERLTNALHLLTEAQQLSHIGSWEWEIATNTVSWTEELYRIYGRDPETFESSYENFLECIHKDDRGRIAAIIQGAYQQKVGFSFSHRVVSPGGVEKFVDCKGNVYTDDAGNITRMTGTAQDITDLWKAEEKAIRLAAIVESSGDAIISKTTSGIIKSWNRQAEYLFGFSEKEILDRHVSIIVPQGKLREEEDILRQINEGKDLINYETERMKKDGTIFDVAVTISPIKDAAGKVTGISNIIRDITEKKQAQERLIAYTHALEQKNKETEQFAYIASHDLQEPLRTITNYIGLLSEDYKGRLDTSADMYLNFISNASNRMKLLIRDILEYTRIEKEGKPGLIDLNDLIKDITSDMELAISENDAEIKISHLPSMMGYYSSLRSLFQNLLSNAIKFRKKDVVPQITITCQDTGKNFLFTVSDNGIGIEEQYFDKIFKIFQRLHTRTEYNGTGIGLAHCKKIVDLRGGKIWVESTYGVGSTFFISLPKNFIL